MKDYPCDTCKRREYCDDDPHWEYHEGEKEYLCSGYVREIMKNKCLSCGGDVKLWRENVVMRFTRNGYPLRGDVYKCIECKEKWDDLDLRGEAE